MIPPRGRFLDGSLERERDREYRLPRSESRSDLVTLRDDEEYRDV